MQSYDTTCVRPFLDGCQDEAFGLAVGLWTVRSDADVADRMAMQDGLMAAGPVGRSVVGHDALDADPMLGKPREGALQELCRRRAALIREQLHVRDARGIVHRDVEVLPTSAAPRATDRPGAWGQRWPPTQGEKASQLLGIDVQQFARALTLISSHGRTRLKSSGRDIGTAT